MSRDRYIKTIVRRVSARIVPIPEGLGWRMRDAPPQQTFLGLAEQRKGPSRAVNFTKIGQFAMHSLA